MFLCLNRRNKASYVLKLSLTTPILCISINPDFMVKIPAHELPPGINAAKIQDIECQAANRFREGLEYFIGLPRNPI